MGVALLLAAGLPASGQETPAPPPPATPAPVQPPAPSTPAPEAKKPEPPAPKPESEPPVPTGDGGTEIVVYMKDGKSLTGMLVRETRDEMTIKISGIETPIETKLIDRYQILEPILERYRKFRAAIGENTDQILMLVSWLQAREQFELAMYEVERLLRLDPHNKQGLGLKKAIQSQMDLRNAARPKEGNGTGKVAKKPESPREDRDADAREPFPLLSDAQIGLIKVFEIDIDNPPRVLISRETIKKLLDTYAGSPLLPATEEGRDAVYRKPPVEVLDLMFRLRARELYGEVEVLDQPRALRMFRDDVQAGWLVNSCATNACHGGTEAGRLMLVNRKPRSEVSAYTNFLILERYRLNDGTALLNYDGPARSPLLQKALPRADSSSPHPEVPRGPKGNDIWKPLFRNAQERGFERAVAWMKAMYRPRPTYPIEYRPPRPSEPPVRDKAEPSPR